MNKTIKFILLTTAILGCKLEGTVTENNETAKPTTQQSITKPTAHGENILLITCKEEVGGLKEEIRVLQIENGKLLASMNLMQTQELTTNPPYADGEVPVATSSVSIANTQISRNSNSSVDIYGGSYENGVFTGPNQISASVTNGYLNISKGGISIISNMQLSEYNKRYMATLNPDIFAIVKEYSGITYLVRSRLLVDVSDGTVKILSGLTEWNTITCVTATSAQLEVIIPVSESDFKATGWTYNGNANIITLEKEEKIQKIITIDNCPMPKMVVDSLIENNDFTFSYDTATEGMSGDLGDEYTHECFETHPSQSCDEYKASQDKVNINVGEFEVVRLTTDTTDMELPTYKYPDRVIPVLETEELVQETRDFKTADDIKGESFPIIGGSGFVKPLQGLDGGDVMITGGSMNPSLLKGMQGENDTTETFTSQNIIDLDGSVNEAGVITGTIPADWGTN